MTFPLPQLQYECTGICNIPEDSTARFQSPWCLYD